MQQTKYRAEIDGLRALAVLSVLFFHLGAPSFRGGYVGVDVFFVISGFLITRLIRDEVLETGRLSFIHFYLRRARRLLPAFLFTLTLTFITALLLFPPPQMEAFGESLVYSTFSLANVHFWNQSGYFDTASVYKPLLHIWSLSVEEQFYLIWPLALSLLMIKTPKRAAPLALLAAFGISLWLNPIFINGQIGWLTNLIPAAADWFEEGAAAVFYLMPFRVFEFSIGALLVWMIPIQPRDKCWLEAPFFIGLGMVIVPMLTYTEATVFPSFNALIPCIGAALIIYSGQARFGGGLLRFSPLVEIGKFSYSLYLVHWVAIVFYKYYRYDFGALSLAEQILLAAASIGAARLMCLYVEQPFRKTHGQAAAVSTRAFLALHSALAITLLALAVSAWKFDGWAWRMPHSLTAAQIEAGKARKAEWGNGCLITRLDSAKCSPQAALQVLVIGDSHYYVGYNMLAESFYKDETVNLISFGEINKCGFTVQGEEIQAQGGGARTKSKCAERAAILNDPQFNRALDVLVVSSQTAFEKGAELPIIQRLKNANPALRLVVIGTYIDLRPYECADIINRFGSSEFCKDPKFVRSFGGEDSRQPFYPAFMEYEPLYINVSALLCPQGTLQSCVTSADSAPMFYDSNHPSLEFSLLMGKRMMDSYAKDLRAAGFPLP